MKVSGPDSIVEAVMPCVAERNWSSYVDEMREQGIEWVIYRPKYISENQKSIVRTTLKEMIGWKYSRAELVLCLLDGLTSKATGRNVIFFRKFDLFRKRVICSKTANRADIKAGLLCRDAYYWDPDEGCDFMMHNPIWLHVAHTNGWYKPLPKATC